MHLRKALDRARNSSTIGSEQMRSLVHELKERYTDRCIIFDTPPVLQKGDAPALASLVDCILMVVGPAAIASKQLRAALEMLPHKKMAGLVLNRFRARSPI